MEKLFINGGVDIAGHLARPHAAPGTKLPGLVLSHGFPHLRQGGRLSARSFSELADRIATEMGWYVLVITLRGCGDSGGDFSMGSWLSDMLAATEWLRDVDGVKGVWTSGFGTGGALAICAAAQDQRIRGVAAMGAPADFDDWAGHPRRLLQHAREVGIVRTAGFPPAFDVSSHEIREIRPIQAAPLMSDRPLLIMHGSEDEMVPVFDARVLADAHGDASLRIIDGAGHQLRHDPRSVAMLLGWLDRQRIAAAAPSA